MSDNAPLSELAKKIEEAKKQVMVGRQYSHFKNPEHTYTVLNIVILEATEEPLVIYKPDYEDTELVFARAIGKWREQVEKDGNTMQRFTLIN